LKVKIVVNSVVILAAATIGLAAGLALRSKRLTEASESAAVTSSAQTGPRASRLRASDESSGPGANDDSPLTTTLERNLAASSGVTRWLCWVEALEKAAPADFPRLARLAQNHPAALQFVAARWAEIAPRHLFDSLVASAKDRRGLPVQELARVLFEEWPKRDPEAAIAALNETGQLGMRHAWQMDVATTVIRQDFERGLRLFEQWHIENYMPFSDERGPVPNWTAADPRHAAEFALDHPCGYLSQGVVKAIGDEWAKTDPAAALRFAAASSGELGSLLGTAALRTWAERDLSQAADWLAGADELARNRLSPGFVEAWAKKDAPGAIAWCEENLSGSSLARAVASVVQGAGAKNIAATAALIGAMEPSPGRAEGAVAVARQWFPSLGGMAGPAGDQTVRPQTVAWLASLDPISIKRVLDEETWEWATSDPNSMADFLLTVDTEVIGDWPDSCLARQMARRNPAAALDWAGQLPGNRGLAAGGEAYAEWRSSQPEAATQWLNALPADDPRREPFFRSAIRLLAYNPQASEQLAAMTDQERIAARSVIENMTSLPEDRRTRLLGGLTPR
jgi:hypothetical protein